MSCTGCIYWQVLSGGNIKACHYALIHHKCRLQPAGKCTFKITIEEVKLMASKIDDARARDLHAAEVRFCNRGGVWPFSEHRFILAA
jgi:hypothetical protein